MKLVECIPNISEGKNKTIINKIVKEIDSVDGVTILDVDSGIDTNRTVITFVGKPEDVIKGAYKCIKSSIELIDMNIHTGSHSRMGATDVCPIVPISNISVKECIEYSNILADKVAANLDLPVFLYEESALKEERINLANIREGEYEGLKNKLKIKKWLPDYGPSSPHKTAGVVAIGVRKILIAYNINLNTKNKKIATDIALDIREQGRNKRNKSGKFERDKDGNTIKVPGIFKKCKAVGWYIEEYDQAQVSINLTDYETTPIHLVFEEVRKQANKRGVRVTGSELVGLVPLDAMVIAGKYYLRKQKNSTGVPESEIIKNAIQSLGLSNLQTFSPKEKIIEYAVKKEEKLINMKINNFLDLLSSNSPAPGGGSVSALTIALSASLTSMVANLTMGLKKWDPIYLEMCRIAENCQYIKFNMQKLIDLDTNAFNELMLCYRMPKNNKININNRKNAIDAALKNATEIPFEILNNSLSIIKLGEDVLKLGNPNALSDAGVAIELAYAGSFSAYYNILINLKDVDDKIYIKETKEKSKIIIKKIQKIHLNAHEKINKILITNE